jgi:hypothetical protein
VKIVWLVFTDAWAWVRVRRVLCEDVSSGWRDSR